MNWCQPHWDQLREAVRIRGLDHLGAQDPMAAARDLATELEGGEPPFDPLMGSWTRINLYMLESMEKSGTVSTERILACPLCLLVADGQPHLVVNWIDGCTDSALVYALAKGLISKPS